MKILVVGFQRSGTTLLRRLLACHPEIKRMFHEVCLMNKYKSKKELKTSMKFDIENVTWGEKVAYYPSVRKTPVYKYCEKWQKTFPEDNCIIHIIRNPYDVCISNKKTFGQPIDKSIEMYQIVSNITPKIQKLKNVLTLKYENLLLNQEGVIPHIFEFCGVSPNINYEKHLMKNNKESYRKINSERAFSYKNEKIKFDYDFSNDFKILNEFEGPKYELQR